MAVSQLVLALTAVFLGQLSKVCEPQQGLAVFGALRYIDRVDPESELVSNLNLD